MHICAERLHSEGKYCSSFMRIYFRHLIIIVSLFHITNILLSALASDKAPFIGLNSLKEYKFSGISNTSISNCVW
jgi:hypothetical protein